MSADVRGFEGPQSVTPDLVGQMIDLINHIFRKDGTSNMRDEFPVLFGDANLENCVVILAGGRPISHVGYVPREVLINGARISVACVGAVCTHEDYRGLGLSSRILDECERRMCARGIDVAIISGFRGLYLRRGARRVGRGHRFVIPSSAAATLADPRMTIRPGGVGEADVLARLYETKPVRYLRSAGDWAAWLRCGRCECDPSRPLIGYVNDEPVAYVVNAYQSRRAQPVESLRVERPLCAAVEWAGEPDHILGLLAAVPADGGREGVALTVYEREDTPLLRALDAAGLASTPAESGPVVKVLRPAALFEKLRPYLPAAARSIVATDAGEGPTLTLGDGVLALAVDEVARALFGDRENLLPARFGSAGRLGRALLDALPFPLPRYGYNYI